MKFTSGTPVTLHEQYTEIQRNVICSPKSEDLSGLPSPPISDLKRAQYAQGKTIYANHGQKFVFVRVCVCTC